MPLLAGKRLGPYEILSPLGAGGMGEVYRARDSRLDREVAIKVLPGHLAQNPQALSRFVRETKAVAALSHPNILAIFDIGAENGIHYAVTELLEGETLRASLSRGTMAWRKAAEQGAALADGLVAAHSKGISHRDLKPDNIFLTSDGRVKILDFGLARMEPDPLTPAGEEETQTEAGTLMGTPGYMSPEQVRGERAGPLSDIFSLGCVLYEMVGGKKAFAGQNPGESMAAILRDSPQELAGSPEFSRVIFRCLEKTLEQRLQTARELAGQLKAILSTPEVAAPASVVIDSIAVLPFSNASNDPDTEYLCDGITESIMNSLARVGQLKVTPRSTVFRYKAREVDPQTVGRELGVRSVLTGRVMQRGDNLVIGTELVDIAGGSQLWGERYHRKLADIFAVEEEIARKISESLRVKLSGQDKNRLSKRFTEDTEAYQLYLRGRHHWAKRTPEHVKKGAGFFQQAIEKDPSYALAYSGLADCYSILAVYSVLPPKETFARAKAAAAAAMAFDPELAEAHTSLGFILANLDLDWEAGCREFQRAHELNPTYWVTPYWHAIVLTSMGRFEESEEQIRRGFEIEPHSSVIAHESAFNCFGARRYGEAMERCRKGLKNDPDYWLLRYWLAMAHQFEGRHTEAIEELQTSMRLSNGVPWVAGGLGNAYAAAGNQAEASRVLEDLLAQGERQTIDFAAVAMIYAGMGDVENALLFLEKACDTRGMVTIFVKTDPRFDPLREMPRFRQVLSRLNLLG